MKTVKIRNLEVGTGTPKVIVPIVANTPEGVVAKGRELAGYAMDVIEWRVDFMNEVFHTDVVLKTAEDLRAVLGDRPILFTFRSKKEGGERNIEMSAYTSLNQAVVESGFVDAVDVEIFSGDSVVLENISNIHAAGKIVIGSNHDFHKTPSQADLIYRLRKMQDMGADIPKIAVMPETKADVLTLLSATEEMSRCYADRPIITMSMSAVGVISRLCGEVFGSSMTFGAVGQVSAPGQIPVERLRQATQIIHDAL